MTGTYAATTSVSVDSSIQEIRRTIRRYKADRFAYAESTTSATVGFEASGRKVRFDLPLPDRAKFRVTPAGRARTSAGAIDEAHEQACRQVWRALALVIKAKLEAVEAGIVTFEQEFGMHMVLPDGRTVAETVIPAITTAYNTGGPLELTA